MSGRERLEDRIIDAMAVLSSISEAYLEDLAATFSTGMRRGTVQPLTVLHRIGASRVTALAAALGLDHTTVTRHLDELASHGLVTRRPDERDRRVMVVSLMPSAAARLDALHDRNRRHVRQLCVDWTPEEREMFGRLFPRSRQSGDEFSLVRPPAVPVQRFRSQAGG